MAYSGDLSNSITKLLGVSSVTVRAHDRALAEAGFRATGGCGPSAAKMGSRRCQSFGICRRG